MSDLRAYAKGRPCQIRVPGRCNRNPETTVLCHIRMAEIPIDENGKLPDLLAAFGCSDCHAIVDGQAGSWIEFPDHRRQLLLLEGVMRTQSYLIRQGMVTW